MLGSAVLAIIAATILVTSFISGIFGMAGGLILLGVLLVFLDVAPAMVLFGTIQTAANGWRATLWWRHVHVGIVWRFLVGSTLMFLAQSYVERLAVAIPEVRAYFESVAAQRAHDNNLRLRGRAFPSGEVKVDPSQAILL